MKLVEALKELKTLNEAPDEMGFLTDDEIEAQERADFEKRLAQKKAQRDVEKEKELTRIKKEQEKQKRMEQSKATLEKLSETRKLDDIWKDVVPGQGMAKTIAGEIVRAYSRVLYRAFNDGDLFYGGYGLETAGGSMQYLLDTIKDEEFENRVNNISEDLVGFEDYSGIPFDRYIEKIEDLEPIIVDFLLDNPELFAEENTTDSREMELDDQYQPELEYTIYIGDYNYKYDNGDMAYGILKDFLDNGDISTDDVADELDTMMYGNGFGKYDFSIWSHDSDQFEVTNLDIDGYNLLKQWANDEFLFDYYIGELIDKYGDPNEEEDEDYEESLKEDMSDKVIRVYRLITKDGEYIPYGDNKSSFYNAGDTILQYSSELDEYNDLGDTFEDKLEYCKRHYSDSNYEINVTNTDGSNSHYVGKPINYKTWGFDEWGNKLEDDEYDESLKEDNDSEFSVGDKLNISSIDRSYFKSLARTTKNLTREQQNSFNYATKLEPVATVLNVTDKGLLLSIGYFVWNDEKTKQLKKVINVWCPKSNFKKRKKVSEDINSLAKKMGAKLLPPKNYGKPKPRYVYEVYWYDNEECDGDPIFRKFSSNKSRETWYEQHKDDPDKFSMCADLPSYNVNEELQINKSVKPIKESQSQEIAKEYEFLAEITGVDVGDLVYGKGNFMDTFYPYSPDNDYVYFPDFDGDVIFSEKHWREFTDWVKKEKGIDLKAKIDEYNKRYSDYSENLTEAFGGADKIFIDQYSNIKSAKPEDVAYVILPKKKVYIVTNHKEIPNYFKGTFLQSYPQETLDDVKNFAKRIIDRLDAKEVTPEEFEQIEKSDEKERVAKAFAHAEQSFREDNKSNKISKLIKESYKGTQALEFFQLCQKLKLKTMEDVQNFSEEHNGVKDQELLQALRDEVIKLEQEKKEQ